MLFGETVAVYYENRTEHADTFCGQSVPHRKHFMAPLQSPIGWCCLGKLAVYCENITEHTDTLCGQNAGFGMLQNLVHLVTTKFKGILRRYDVEMDESRECRWVYATPPLPLGHRACCASQPAERRLLLLSETEQQFLVRPADSLITTLTELWH
jgi:hypothetical protein